MSEIKSYLLTYLLTYSCFPPPQRISCFPPPQRISCFPPPQSISCFPPPQSISCLKLLTKNLLTDIISVTDLVEPYAMHRLSIYVERNLNVQLERFVDKFLQQTK